MTWGPTMQSTPRKGYHSITPRIAVDDADAVYRRALRGGAVSIEEPVDTPYGDRRAMVRDPFGNVWQIAHVTTAT